MKYYKVTLSSMNYCGFDNHGVFIVEDNEDIENVILNSVFYEEQQDYIQGWIDDEDYEEDESADAISMWYEEITKEEYDAFVELVGSTYNV